MKIKEYLEDRKLTIDRWIEQNLQPDGSLCPPTIQAAMRYSLMAKSKRIRPILTLAVTESLGGQYQQALPFACGLELIHTYSLIHDDLPAMDNDDFRRGQPSNHKAFGEAMAILAGDGLLTQAFAIMTSPEVMSSLPGKSIVRIIHEIAQAAGTKGMIAGQVMDMESEGKQVALAQVETMHRCKTGAIISAAVRVGALAADASDQELAVLTRYGQSIGLLFQIVDDLLDVEGQPELLGKTVRKDCTAKKATFPSVAGLEESKAYAQRLYLEAIHALESLGARAEILGGLAQLIYTRTC